MNIILKRLTNAPAIEASWIDDSGDQTDCRTYLPEQMNQLRLDIGAVSGDYLEMIAEVEAAATPYVQPPDEYVEAIMASVQSMMDAEAKSPISDSILSLCSYAVSTVPQFAAMGRAGVAWRDGVLLQSHSMIDEWVSGQRDTPYTLEEVLAALPAMVWPS